MLEDSSALGTIVTLRKEKLQFAYDSLEFNLKDSHFTTLFPDLCKEIKKKLAEREKERLEMSQRLGSTDKQSSTDSGDESNRYLVNARNNTSDVQAAVNGGFPHLILIIFFCLGALIFHHAYNLQEQLK